MVGTTEISSSEDQIDTRSVLKRIAYLEIDVNAIAQEEYEELCQLRQLVTKLREDGGGDSPEDGIFLVRDSYFEDYARELAEDIGAVRSDMIWPSAHIDWEAAAESLKMDYMTVEFDGVTYWYR